MINSFLPKALEPLSSDSLTRVGQDHDGGYVVDQRSVAAADILLGLGMNDDWSFEEEFIKYNKTPTYIFDGTVGQNRFIKNLILSMFRLDKISYFAHWLKTIIKYKLFFRNKAHHIQLLVDDIQGKEFISFPDLVSKYVTDSHQKIFLKIDIEGSEYRLLKHLLAISERIAGMVIDFHNVDLHLEKIIELTKDFSLDLCHVHVNNYGGLNNESIPLAIECTFSAFNCEMNQSISSSGQLDMPNNSEADDIKITFI